MFFFVARKGSHKLYKRSLYRKASSKYWLCLVCCYIKYIVFFYQKLFTWKWNHGNLPITWTQLRLAPGLPQPWWICSMDGRMDYFQDTHSIIYWSVKLFLYITLSSGFLNHFTIFLFTFFSKCNKFILHTVSVYILNANIS